MTDLLPPIVLDALQSEDPRKRAAAIAMAFLFFAGLLLRYRAWRQHVTDTKIWNEMIANSPDLTPAEKLKRIKSNPPPPIPPGLHVWGVLFVSAAFAAGVVSSTPTPRNEIAGPVVRRCDPPCKAPQRCENGTCTDAAADTERTPQPSPPPDPPPRRRKSSARPSPGQVAVSVPGWVDVAPGASPFGRPI